MYILVLYNVFTTSYWIVQSINFWYVEDKTRETLVNKTPFGRR